MKSKSRTYTGAGVVALLTVLTVGALFSVSNIANKISAEYDPQADASMELKVELAYFHLWLEEFLSGDKTVPQEKVFGHLDESLWFAQALLNGGRRDVGVYLPLESGSSRKQVEKLIVEIHVLRGLATSRVANANKQMAGSIEDSRFDTVFNRSIALAETLESVLRARSAGQFSHFRLINEILIGLTLLAGLMAGLLLLRINRQRERHIRELTATKEQLASDIEESTRELSERESFVRTVVETMADGVVTIDEQGIVTSFNTAAESIFQIGAKNVIGKNVSMLMPEPYSSEHNLFLKRYITTGDSRILGKTMSLTGLRNVDETFPISLSVSESYNGDSRFFTGIIRDISGLKQAEETIRLSEELLSTAIENISDGFAIFDADDRLVRINRKFRNTYSRSIDLWVPGAKYADIILGAAKRGEFEDAIGREDEWVAEVLAEQGTGKFVSRELNMGGGQWIMATNCYLPDGGFVAIRNDISALKAANNDLQMAQVEADRANRAKSEFLSSMSHELRTPLNAILGFSQLLEYTELSDDQKESVDFIKSGGEHLLRLINEVLELSRVEAGKLSISIEIVRPEDLIDDCIAQVEGEASKRDIAIVNMASSGVPAVMADVTRIRQVFLNLLSNAVKYNRDGGGVELSAMTVDGMVRFSVSDTGVGIPLDKHKLVFEPFNRLGAEATKVDGTGIGLTITRQIVEMMHGEIGFHSEPGEGSTFWFSIPAASAMDMGFDPDEATNVELAALDDALKEEEGTRTLLYVEDNPANMMLMEKIIDRVSHLKLISAIDAESGLELARRTIPDVILMDIHLPGMDGFEAYDRLKDNPSTENIPVIALTASAMSTDVKRGLEHGFEDYLTKPIEFDRFLASLEKALISDMVKKSLNP